MIRKIDKQTDHVPCISDCYKLSGNPNLMKYKTQEFIIGAHICI